MSDKEKEIFLILKGWYKEDMEDFKMRYPNAKLREPYWLHSNYSYISQTIDPVYGFQLRQDGIIN